TAAGQRLSVTGMAGDLVMIDIGPYAFATAKGIKVGDEVQIDNSIYLAVQTYHRHQVPTPDYDGWKQFRGPDGKPIYPQRDKIVGPVVPERAAGSLQSGKFTGKMIVVESMLDEAAHPWHADWYRSHVKEHLGAKLDDNFRLYFTDHAMHTAPAKKDQ